KATVAIENPPENIFELVRDDQVETLTSANPESILQVPAEHAPLTVDASKPENLAANPLDWMASAPPLPVEPVEEGAAEFDVHADEAPVENLAEHPTASPVEPSVPPPSSTHIEEPIIEPSVVAHHADAAQEPATVALQPVMIEEKPDE